MDLLSAEEGVARAAELVRAGEVVAFPTDTVYGLAAVPEAAEKVYAAKRRPADKQLIAMAASVEPVAELVEIDERARELMERWWPGALTLVLRTHSGAPPTLGVRIPDHPLALAFLRAVGRPVLTTSANLSGSPPAMTAQEVALEGVAAVLDGGRAPGGRPSTVLDLTTEEPRVVRAGPVYP
ncbi:MAG TPA: L-threonylcarbamoyladenylate synthase [Candidatus Dormibacteraeota bacterium]